MAIDNTAVVDAVAYEGDKLILQLYDHLELDNDNCSITKCSDLSSSDCGYRVEKMR